MTSMPASRSAAATTFAPRSWPSRPGFATSTRMGRSMTMKLVGLPGDEQHLARRAAQRPVAPSVERLLDDQPLRGAQLGETRRRVETDAVLALPARLLPLPRRADRHHAGE